MKNPILHFSVIYFNIYVPNNLVHDLEHVRW